MRNLYFRYKEQINYLIAGGMTTLVSLGSYYFCVLTFLDPKDGIQLQIANGISWILAVTFAYWSNRRFVFESKNDHILIEASAFYMSRISTLLMDMLIMFVTVTWIGMNDKIAKLLVQVVVMIANYILSKCIVFKNKGWRDDR